MFNIFKKKKAVKKPKMSQEEFERRKAAYSNIPEDAEPFCEEFQQDRINGIWHQYISFCFDLMNIDHIISLLNKTENQIREMVEKQDEEAHYMAAVYPLFINVLEMAMPIFELGWCNAIVSYRPYNNEAFLKKNDISSELTFEKFVEWSKWADKACEDGIKTGKRTKAYVKGFETQFKSKKNSGEKKAPRNNDEKTDFFDWSYEDYHNMVFCPEVMEYYFSILEYYSADIYGNVVYYNDIEEPSSYTQIFYPNQDKEAFVNTFKKRSEELKKLAK